MQPTYSEIFAALGQVDSEVSSLLESMAASGALPAVPDHGARELLAHAGSIAARLADLRPLGRSAEPYQLAEFAVALRAEIDAKKAKTPICPVLLAAVEARLALGSIEAAAA